MNGMSVKDEIKIENLIYNFRGKQVMLDRDLAKLYQCKNGTKTINLAVKRHINRFPDRFMFKLTKEEYYEILRFQNETLELKQGKYSKYLPYAFTEQGVTMLSAVLKTEVAESISVQIMDAYIAMRKYISENLIEQKLISEMVLRHERDIKSIQNVLDKLSEKEIKNQIYFNGQIYDSYSKIIDIMSIAKEELLIVDGYADKTVLDMISKLKVKVTLITKTKSLLRKLDIEKYNKQYNNLNIIYNDTFHDRYFILDKKTIYHCGTSINHIGSKTFSINKLEDEVIINLLIEKIEKIINKNN